jgi:hypothetical protein
MTRRFTLVAILGVLLATLPTHAQPPVVVTQEALDAYWRELDQLKAAIAQGRAEGEQRLFKALLASGLLLLGSGFWIWGSRRSSRRHHSEILALVNRECEQIDRVVKLLESIDGKLRPPNP